MIIEILGVFMNEKTEKIIVATLWILLGSIMILLFLYVYRWIAHLG